MTVLWSRISSVEQHRIYIIQSNAKTTGLSMQYTR